MNKRPVRQLWHYPARYECIECHSPAGGYGLGFNTRQMNGSHVYGTQNLNQIKALSDAATSPRRESPALNDFPALAKASDTTQSLEWRVRSYFAANCLPMPSARVAKPTLTGMRARLH